MPLLGADGFETRSNQRVLLARRSGLHVARIDHLLGRYGGRVDDLLALIGERQVLGLPLEGAEDYLAAEIVYAVTHEGARHLDDVLTRRTRISIETFDRGVSAAPAAAQLMGGRAGLVGRAGRRGGRPLPAPGRGRAPVAAQAHRPGGRRGPGAGHRHRLPPALREDLSMDNEQAHELARAGRRGWFYLLVRVLLVPIIRLVFAMRVSGVENVPKKGPVVIAPNHKSFWDGLFIAAVLPRRIFFMGKAELFEGRGGSLLLALGAFPVRRGASDAEAIETALAILRRGDALALFPEGTRVADPELLGKPRKGAARLAIEGGAPIVPTAITGTEKRRWPLPRRVQISLRGADPGHRPPGNPRGRRPTHRGRRLAGDRRGLPRAPRPSWPRSPRAWPRSAPATPSTACATAAAEVRSGDVGRRVGQLDQPHLGQRRHLVDEEPAERQVAARVVERGHGVGVVGEAVRHDDGHRAVAVGHGGADVDRAARVGARCGWP